MQPEHTDSYIFVFPVLLVNSSILDYLLESAEIIPENSGIIGNFLLETIFRIFLYKHTPKKVVGVM